jgi:hypothetical protein
MVMKWYQNGSATEYLKGGGVEVDRMALVGAVMSVLHTS